jgi:hypothetical protein
VTAEVQLIVCLKPITEASDEFRLIVAFESASRHDVEDSVRSVSFVRLVASSLHLKVIDVLGIYLWTQVAGDICIRDGNAVDQPVHLVTAAHVQHVVSNVSTWNIVRDHRDTISAIRARSLSCILPANQSGRRNGIGIHVLLVFGRHDSCLIHARDFPLKVKHRSGAGNHCKSLF